MPNLKYNTDELRQAAKRFTELADKIETVRRDLQKSIEDLKAQYWISDGGEAFMSLYEDTWSSEAEKYELVLKELSILLNKAAVDYMDVTLKLNEIPEVHIS